MSNFFKPENILHCIDFQLQTIVFTSTFNDMAYFGLMNWMDQITACPNSDNLNCLTNLFRGGQDNNIGIRCNVPKVIKTINR